MPKKPIDYSKTHFYKIVCNDTNIKDCYVGHTTDFKRRKYEHKKHCKAEYDKHYNIKVYKFIRENGGWENWEMILLKTESCENGMEARSRERYYKEQEQATLNVNVPARTIQEYKNDNYEYLLQYYRKYYYDNIDDKKFKGKQYRETHKEQKSIMDKKYRENNKDKVREYNKRYRENNKDKIQLRENETYSCKCGCEVRKCNRVRHEKTNKHQRLINQVEE